MGVVGPMPGTERGCRVSSVSAGEGRSLQGGLSLQPSYFNNGA